MVFEGETSGDTLGQSVSVSGITAVVGAPSPDDSTGSGSASVNSFDETDNWHRVALLESNRNTTGENFGHSVSASGDTIVVGARYASPSGKDGAGTASIFFRDWSGNWSLVQTLEGLKQYENFGESVSVSGNLTAFLARESTERELLSAIKSQMQSILC